MLTALTLEDNSLVKALAEEPGHGRVMVVDGGGSLRRALLGDQIAEKACLNVLAINKFPMVWVSKYQAASLGCLLRRVNRAMASRAIKIL